MMGMRRSVGAAGVGGGAGFGAVGGGVAAIAQRPGAALGEADARARSGDGVGALVLGDERIGLAPGRVPARQREKRCSRHSRAWVMWDSSRTGGSVRRRSRVTMRAMAALRPERMRARRVVRVDIGS